MTGIKYTLVLISTSLLHRKKKKNKKSKSNTISSDLSRTNDDILSWI